MIATPIYINLFHHLTGKAGKNSSSGSTNTYIPNARHHKTLRLHLLRVWRATLGGRRPQAIESRYLLRTVKDCTSKGILLFFAKEQALYRYGTSLFIFLPGRRMVAARKVFSSIPGPEEVAESGHQRRKSRLFQPRDVHRGHMGSGDVCQSRQVQDARLVRSVGFTFSARDMEV